jgi:hypothetical protein
MQYLRTLEQMPREVWIAAGVGALVGLIVAMLLMRGGRRRYVFVGSSPSTELFTFQLGRVADALDRIAFERMATAREAPQSEPSGRTAPSSEPAPLSESRPGHRVSMSMFGR